MAQQSNDHCTLISTLCGLEPHDAHHSVSRVITASPETRRNYLNEASGHSGPSLFLLRPSEYIKRLRNIGC